MFMIDVLLIAILALILSGLLVGFIGWRRPSESTLSATLFMFVILLFTLWAAYLWIPPAGPMLGGVALIPLLLIGLVIALTAAAVTPPRPSRMDLPEAQREAQIEEEAVEAFGLFFWILVALLLVAIVVGYTW